MRVFSRGNAKQDVIDLVIDYLGWIDYEVLRGVDTVICRLRTAAEDDDKGNVRSIPSVSLIRNEAIERVFILRGCRSSLLPLTKTISSGR